MNKEELIIKLKLLRRIETEESPSASVYEAIDTLIQVSEFLLNEYQPERSKREDYGKAFHFVCEDKGI